MPYPDTTTKPSTTGREFADGARDNDMLDWQIATQIGLASRGDKDLLSKQYAARDRIYKLSCEVWDLRAQLKDAQATSGQGPELAQVMRNASKELEVVSTEGNLQFIEEFYQVSRAVRRMIRVGLEKAGYSL